MRHWNAAIAAVLAALLPPLATPTQAAGGLLIIYVSPDPIGVNDFLKLGRIGTERVARALGGEAKVFESTDPATQRQNLEAAARQNAAVVVTVGFEFNDLVPDVAARYPAVKFLMVDSCAKTLKPNIYCATFREYEPSFLAGAEAALTSRTGRVGSVGALDIPFLHRYTDGFAEGAKHAKPDVAVAPTLWVGGSNPFSDPARAQQRAAAMLAGGADRVFAAASGSNGGVFKAMRGSTGALAFGVDVNQCPQAPGAVIDNVEKLTDKVVEQGVSGIMHGNQPQTATFGLKEGGMTLTSLRPDVAQSQCMITRWPEVIEKIKALRGEIESGAITLRDPMAAK